METSEERGMMECVELPPATALEFWDELESYVEAALVHDITRSTSKEDVLEQLEKGYARVLICSDGERIASATIMQAFINRRDERILHVICTAGEEMHTWLPVLIGKLEEIAQLEECDAITMQGRPGWNRKLNKYGFKTEVVSMRLEAHGRIQSAKLAVVR